MTLGETGYFYAALYNNLQLKILNDVYTEYQVEYGQSPRKAATPSDIFGFSQMIKFVVAFRNICAHEERMYDNVVKHKGKIPKIMYFHMNTPLRFTSRCMDVLHILGLFLIKSDYKCLVKVVTAEINVLSKELQSSTTNEVLIKAGFPKDWKKVLSLPK